MKIAIFSTDTICCRLIDEALPSHHITVLAQGTRPPVEKMHDNLDVVCGDMTDLNSLKTALTGQDVAVAALSSLAIGSEASAIIQAMQQSGVRRFVAITKPKKRSNSWIRRCFERLFPEQEADTSAIEWLMKRSGLEWAIICPPELTNTPPTGTCRLSDRPSGTLSSADGARFMLDEVEMLPHAGRIVALAS